RQIHTRCAQVAQKRAVEGSRFTPCGNSVVLTADWSSQRTQGANLALWRGRAGARGGPAKGLARGRVGGVVRLTLERERTYTSRSVSRSRGAFVCAHPGTLRHSPEAFPAVGSRAWRRGAVHEPPSAVPTDSTIRITARFSLPTISQLVRKGRTPAIKKVKAPALRR